MGAFNILHATAKCQSCSQLADFDIQFKYGSVWQLEYEIGQKLLWDGNNKGLPGQEKVVVEGISGSCPLCKADFQEFEIVIESDVITSVQPA